MPLDNVALVTPRHDIDRPAPAAAPATVVNIATEAYSRGVDFHAHHARKLRIAAAQLADSARKLAVHSQDIQRSLDKLAIHQQTLKAEAARGRRIAEQAGRIAEAIDAGDIASLHAMRAAAAQEKR